MVVVSTTSSGPPPRARGARQALAGGHVLVGTTPARAGSTRRAASGSGRGGDHPRACGEHVLAVAGFGGGEGPSPRVRGAPNAAHSPTRRMGDHPRACEEHIPPNSRCGRNRGPSPRVRGAHDRGEPRGVRTGTIPARAGSTYAPTAGPREAGDHPRACGEHAIRYSGRSLVGGPSPRVRGARVDTGALPRPDRDHPRACGEHLRHRGGAGRRVGPSPRVRGARGPPDVAEARRGTIPARAGSTVAGVSCSPISRDHPRACGEHPLSTGGAYPPLGPSPRVRGALRAAAEVGQPFGTIPARAGSTAAGVLSGVLTRDHPRACGEHCPLPLPPPVPLGPSPRVRGARWSDHVRHPGRGTIPACAGSTAARYPQVRHNGDHPRVRGEHTGAGPPTTPNPGPSPRARGAPHPHRRRPLPGGTIPACAGSTPPRARPRSRPRDHPRVRGEHPHFPGTDTLSMGPSPRARGARRDPVDQRFHRGTIPACAGSTSPTGMSVARRRDHPRVRGEHGMGQPDCQARRGPSPRARGAPQDHPAR